MIRNVIIEMKTCAEELPVELWLSIFSYFEIHELFRTFANVSDSFDRLLNSNQLFFYIRLEKNDRSLVFQSKFNRVIYLQSTRWHASEGFPKFLHDQIDQFVRLRTLKVCISTTQTNLLCRALEILGSLEYLSLRCRMTDQLFAAIISASHLRICHFEFYKSDETISYHSNIINHLQVLSLNISNPSDYPIINLLLLHMLNLKRLEIFHYDYGHSDSTFSFLHQPLLLPNIRTVHLKWNFHYMQRDLFERLIKTMPMLKRLSLDLFCYYLNEDFFSNLIHYWYLNFIEIESIHISIRGYSNFHPMSSEDRRRKLDYYRENFLARKAQFDQRYQIQWIENDTPQMITMNIFMSE